MLERHFAPRWQFRRRWERRVPPSLGGVSADERVTDSGIENQKRFYRGADLKDFDEEAQLGDRAPIHIPEAFKRRCTAGDCGRCGSTLASGAPKRPMNVLSFFWTPARRGSLAPRPRPRRWALTPTTCEPKVKVGKVGVAISSLEDMRLLLRDLPLAEVTTSDDHQRDRGDALVALSARWRRARKYWRATSRHRAKRHLEGSTWREVRISIRPGRRCASWWTPLPYCAKEMPNWNTISISGYHIREAGSTGVQEIAFTLANGIAYVEAALAAGTDLDVFRANDSVFSSTRTTISSKRWPNIARHVDCGLRSCASASGSTRSSFDDVALSYSDRWLDADGPTA